MGRAANIPVCWGCDAVAPCGPRFARSGWVARGVTFMGVFLREVYCPGCWAANGRRFVHLKPPAGGRRVDPETPPPRAPRTARLYLDHAQRRTERCR